MRLPMTRIVILSYHLST